MSNLRENTITFNCKSYVAHYLRTKYLLHGNVIELPRKSHVRNLFLACLEKNFTESHHEKLTGYQDSVQIFVNDDILKKHGKKISPAFASLFNSVMEEKIKNEAFYIISIIRVKHNYTAARAILEFQAIYNFFDSFSFSAIKADYYRSLNEAEEIISKKKTATKTNQTCTAYH